MGFETTRRDFVKGAIVCGAGVAGGSLLAACSPASKQSSADASSAGVASWRTPPTPIAEADIAKTYSADFVVIGAGHSGTSATRVLAEAGKTVICIEAQPQDKYVINGNDIGHINSQYLAKRGVPKVDEIEFFNNWMLASNNRASQELVMQYVKNSGAAVDWLFSLFSDEQLASMHLDFWPDTGKTMYHMNTGLKYWIGTPQLIGKVADGTDFNMTAAYKIVHEHITGYDNAEIHFSVTATQLTLKDGAVTGVVAKDADGRYVRYVAAKAVMLAAGDFAGNEEMRVDLLQPQFESLDEGAKVTGMGRDGSGIKMGYWAGGRIEPMPLAVMGDFDTSAPSRYAALWLDGEGRRYCNEWFGDYVSTGFQNARHKLGTRYIAFDSTITEAVQYNVPGHGSFDPTVAGAIEGVQTALNEAYAAGSAGRKAGDRDPGPLYAADTLEKVADYAGMDAGTKANFLQQVQHYNELCQTGKDTDFGKDPRVLFPLTNPPYYLYVANTPNSGMMLVTCGGLMADRNQQVLDKKRDPIPGLYVSGNCCGMRFGPAYFTPLAGVSLGMAITMGKVLGEHLVTL